MWPWNRQGTLGNRMTELEQEVSKLRADVKSALREVSEISERAYKHLKRAEVRARRELDTEGESGTARVRESAPATPPSSSSHRAQWGPRQRRLARLARRDPADEPEEGATDGVPS